MSNRAVALACREAAGRGWTIISEEQVSGHYRAMRVPQKCWKQDRGCVANRHVPDELVTAPLQGVVTRINH